MFPAARQLASRLTSPATLLRALWWFAGLALVLGWVRDPLFALLPAARELPRLDGRSGVPWIAGDFVPQTIAAGQLPPGIQYVSTWVGSDAAVGRAETAWFKAHRRTVYVAVAGYPTRPGRSLVAEFRDAAGATVARLDFRASGEPDPREEWALWEIRRPAAAVAVRLVASDRATGFAGWFAFSHPFRAPPPELAAAYQLLQLAATAALALVLLWGPGLLACPAAASAPTRLLWFLGLGPLTLAALGAVVWAAGPLVPPRLAATVLVAALWLALGHHARRRAFTLPVTPVHARLLAVAALVVLAAVAKSGVSRGPAGELFRGTVSRNFALSDRIDSRFNFYAVQAAAHGWAPASPRVEKFYYPWTFFSRGPLAGLAAVPVVFATGGQPPADFPDQRWSPFDRFGFAAYRVTLITLAGSVVVAFFLLLLPLVGERWAALGAGLLAFTPFGFHEILFTWPKWIATAWLLAAFALVHARRPLAAGLALGTGFLFHPLVLLWSPLLAAWTLGRAWPDGPVAALRRTAVLTAATAALVLPWMALGAWMPHLPDTPFAGQGNFTRYWFLADSHHATAATWLHTRWLNFANTFVPLHLFADSDSFQHFRFSSAYEFSDAFAKATFLPWNSLPFGLGLALWVLSAVALWRAGRIRRAATLLFVAAPALLLVAYWGGDPLGLLRECGHPLFAAILALVVLAAAAVPGRLAAFLAHPARPWLQLPELLAFLWLPTLGHTSAWPVAFAHFDAVGIGLHLAALAAAAILLGRCAPPTPAPPPALLTALRPRLRLPPPLPALLAVLVLGGTFLLLARHYRALAPAQADAPAVLAGGFSRDGQFRGEPLPGGAALRYWGSWSGSDENTGRLTLGPFPAPAVLRLAVGGYPARPGVGLDLERTDTGAVLPLPVGSDVGERWRIEAFRLPADWLDRPVRLRAHDDSRALGGWIGVSEPLTGGLGGGPAEFFSTLAAAAGTGALLALTAWAALLLLARAAWCPAPWQPLLAVASVALAGYLAFWAWFAHPWIGRLVTAAVPLAALVVVLRGHRAALAPEPPALAEARAVFRLLPWLALAYFALLHLFPSSLEFHGLAARRFLPLPGDNILPHNLADRLVRGLPPRQPGAEWLSSDRPPLQTGWLLLIHEPVAYLGLDPRTVDGAAAVWFQLAWVAAAWGLGRTLGLDRTAAARVVVALAATGFFALHSLYTWPKLAAAAFAVGALALWLPARAPRGALLAGALLAGLAWLAHGGVAFTFLAALPWLLVRFLRDDRRAWLLAAGVFLLLALPWTAYQKIYDPPGHRLLKWHLAGRIEPDPAGVGAALRDAYSARPPAALAAVRVAHLRSQFAGDWSAALALTPARAAERRRDEFFRLARTLALWPLALLALPLAWPRLRPAWPGARPLLGVTFATVLVWCAVMYLPDSAIVHQGSFAVPLVLCTFCAVVAATAPWTLPALALAQTAQFAVTWIPAGTPAVFGPAHPLPVSAGLAAATALVWLLRPAPAPK